MVSQRRYRLDGAWFEVVVEEEMVRGHDLKITYTRYGGRVDPPPTSGWVSCLTCGGGRHPFAESIRDLMLGTTRAQIVERHCGVDSDGR